MRGHTVCFITKSFNLKIPKTGLKSYGDWAFYHAAPHTCVYGILKLPLEIKVASSLELFK